MTEQKLIDELFQNQAMVYTIDGQQVIYSPTQGYLVIDNNNNVYELHDNGKIGTKLYTIENTFPFKNVSKLENTKNFSINQEEFNKLKTAVELKQDYIEFANSLFKNSEKEQKTIQTAFDIIEESKEKEEEIYKGENFKSRDFELYTENPDLYKIETLSGGRKKVVVGDLHGDLKAFLFILLNSGYARYKQGESAIKYFDMKQQKVLTDEEVDQAIKDENRNIVPIPNLEINPDFKGEFTSLGDLIDRGGQSDINICLMAHLLNQQEENKSKKREGKFDSELQYIIGNHEDFYLYLDGVLKDEQYDTKFIRGDYCVLQDLLKGLYNKGQMKLCYAEGNKIFSHTNYTPKNVLQFLDFVIDLEKKLNENFKKILQNRSLYTEEEQEKFENIKEYYIKNKTKLVKLKNKIDQKTELTVEDVQFLSECLNYFMDIYVNFGNLFFHQAEIEKIFKDGQGGKLGFLWQRNGERINGVVQFIGHEGPGKTSCNRNNNVDKLYPRIKTNQHVYMDVAAIEYYNGFGTNGAYTEFSSDGKPIFKKKKIVLKSELRFIPELKGIYELLFKKDIKDLNQQEFDNLKNQIKTLKGTNNYKKLYLAYSEYKHIFYCIKNNIEISLDDVKRYENKEQFLINVIQRKQNVQNFDKKYLKLLKICGFNENNYKDINNQTVKKFYEQQIKKRNELLISQLYNITDFFGNYIFNQNELKKNDFTDKKDLVGIFGVLINKITSKQQFEKFYEWLEENKSNYQISLDDISNFRKNFKERRKRLFKEHTQTTPNVNKMQPQVGNVQSTLPGLILQPQITPNTHNIVTPPQIINSPITQDVSSIQPIIIPSPIQPQGGMQPILTTPSTPNAGGIVTLPQIMPNVNGIQPIIPNPMLQPQITSDVNDVQPTTPNPMQQQPQFNFEIDISDSSNSSNII